MKFIGKTFIFVAGTLFTATLLAGGLDIFTAFETFGYTVASGALFGLGLAISK
ncbi:hypothetical protein JK32_00121 [Shigella phage JK32]|nr:hypothetical protein JK32_00121 [Shigella phage JK32]USL84032.1 putative membrane protein [Escherichia phage W115]